VPKLRKFLNRISLTEGWACLPGAEYRNSSISSFNLSIVSYGEISDPASKVHFQIVLIFNAASSMALYFKSMLELKNKLHIHCSNAVNCQDLLDMVERLVVPGE